MSDSTTKAASGDSVVDSPELKKLEQAAMAEQPETEDTSPEDTQAEDAPEESQFGQAFQSLAEKKGFKDVNDLVRAYENLEGHNTKLAQEVRQALKETRQQAPQRAPDADMTPEQQKALGLLRSIISEEIQKTVQPLREDVETRRAREEITKVKETYGVTDSDVDAALYKLQEIPGITLEDAIKLVTFPQARQKANIHKGRTEKTQQKTRAYAESAKTSKSSGDIDYSKLTLEEMEQILPAHGEFVDYSGKLRRN